MAAVATPIRVVAVDDSLLIREGVAALLGLVDGIELVASCASPGEARAAVEEHRPDVLLSDVRMPPTHRDEGLLLAAELGGTHPELGVVILSQHVSPEYAIALLEHRSRSRAYLLKDRLHDLDTLTAAIRTVAAGGCHIDPLVVEALMAARAGVRSRLADLTPREREILADIAEGRSNQGIADHRVLTRRAVEKHASAIFAKLGLTGEGDTSRRVKATLLHLAEQPE